MSSLRLENSHNFDAVGVLRRVLSRSALLELLEDEIGLGPSAFFLETDRAEIIT